MLFNILDKSLSFLARKTINSEREGPQRDSFWSNVELTKTKQ